MKKNRHYKLLFLVFLISFSIFIFLGCNCKNKHTNPTNNTRTGQSDTNSNKTVPLNSNGINPSDSSDSVTKVVNIKRSEIVSKRIVLLTPNKDSAYIFLYNELINKVSDTVLFISEKLSFDSCVLINASLKDTLINESIKYIFLQSLSTPSLSLKVGDEITWKDYFISSVINVRSNLKNPKLFDKASILQHLFKAELEKDVNKKISFLKDAYRRLQTIVQQPIFESDSSQKIGFNNEDINSLKYDIFVNIALKYKLKISSSSQENKINYLDSIISYCNKANKIDSNQPDSYALKSYALYKQFLMISTIAELRGLCSFMNGNYLSDNQRNKLDTIMHKYAIEIFNIDSFYKKQFGTTNTEWFQIKSEVDNAFSSEIRACIEYYLTHLL